MSSFTTKAIIDSEPHRSHFMLSLLFWFRSSNQFLGFFLTVGVTIPNGFTVLLEGLTIFVSHQKHTPLSCARRRSLAPRRCNANIARMYSTLFWRTWLRTDAAVTASLTVSTAASSVIILSLPHRYRRDAFVRTWCDVQKQVDGWHIDGGNFLAFEIVAFYLNLE